MQPLKPRLPCRQWIFSGPQLIRGSSPRDRLLTSMARSNFPSRREAALRQAQQPAFQKRNAASALVRSSCVLSEPAVGRRAFSTSPRRSREEAEEGGEMDGDESTEILESDYYKRLMAEEEQLDRALDSYDLPLPPSNEREKTQKTKIMEIARLMAELEREVTDMDTPEHPRRTIWNEDEEDPDLLDNDKEEQFLGDDITSMAHAKLEEHREQRQYARAAVWEMPLLAQFAKPFEPPASDMPLRFRYTSYMGEFHPAEKKVVVQFCPSDLDLTEAQQLKLKKLVGPRYNPETEIVHMSCEMFEHQAQNKRYLGDLVEKLVQQAKDPTDMFEDVPLDLRHHEFKVKPKFPREWRMTEERKQQLQQIHAESFLLDKGKKDDGTLVDGLKMIETSFVSAASTPSEEKPEPVPVRVKGKRRHK